MGVVLITGCSSGFGLLAAARLAAAGHTVYASMRNLARKAALLQETEKRGGAVRLVQLDVTDDESIAAALDQITREEGRLQTLVNNAGYGLGGFFEDLEEGEIRAQFETNFFGVQKVIRRALPLMRNSVAASGRRGKIINISSVQGQGAIPGLGAYSASKFALEGFSESLYYELKPFGIAVVLIEPGSFSTPIFADNRQVGRRAGADGSPYTPYSRRLEAYIGRMAESGRGVGNPEVVAQLIEKVVNQPTPKLRYLIGGPARLRLAAKRLLPFKWYAGIVSRVLFGKNP